MFQPPPTPPGSTIMVQSSPLAPQFAAILAFLLLNALKVLAGEIPSLEYLLPFQLFLPLLM